MKEPLFAMRCSILLHVPYIYALFYKPITLYTIWWSLIGNSRTCLQSSIIDGVWCPLIPLVLFQNSGILPSGHLLADSKSCYKLRRGFGVLACPIGRIKKNLSPNKAHEQYMLFSYWKYYFGQIPIDSTSAGVEEEVICRWWWWNLCCVLWMRR